MVRLVFVGVIALVGSCFGPICSGQVRPTGAARSGSAHDGYGFGYAGHPHGRSSVYAFPFYVGGGFGGYGGSYYGDYAGSAPAYPPPGYADPSLQQPGAPPVVINQYFGGPPPMTGPQDPAQSDDQSIHLYQQQPAATGYSPQVASDTHTYLIAYKDHSVYTALAYWIEGSTLHYVTTANTHNQADIGLIDLDFTKKLNADRSMPFNVPVQ